jgi:hypothetical protein
MGDPGYAYPYRRRVRHGACGTVTVLSQADADMFARYPAGIGHLRCRKCSTDPSPTADLFPVADFRWIEDNGADGPAVGSVPDPEPEPEPEDAPFLFAEVTPSAGVAECCTCSSLVPGNRLKAHAKWHRGLPVPVQDGEDAAAG